LDPMLIGQLILLGGVDLGQEDALFLEDLSSLCVFYKLSFYVLKLKIVIRKH
jgi:hypothetical protein